MSYEITVSHTYSLQEEEIEIVRLLDVSKKKWQELAEAIDPISESIFLEEKQSVMTTKLKNAINHQINKMFDQED